MATDTATIPTRDQGIVAHPNGSSFNAYPAGNNQNVSHDNSNPKPIYNQTNGQSSHWDYGGNPLAHANTGDSARLPAFSGYLQPGLYKPPKSNIANPAPLGLCAFALTTFLLSLINFHTHSVTTPSIVIAAAFGYGGLVQLLAGMWYVLLLPTLNKPHFLIYSLGKWLSVIHSVLLLSARMVVSGSLSQ